MVLLVHAAVIPLKSSLMMVRRPITTSHSFACLTNQSAAINAPRLCIPHLAGRSLIPCVRAGDASRIPNEIL